MLYALVWYSLVNSLFWNFGWIWNYFFFFILFFFLYTKFWIMSMALLSKGVNTNLKYWPPKLLLRGQCWKKNSVQWCLWTHKDNLGAKYWFCFTSLGLNVLVFFLWFHRRLNMQIQKSQFPTMSNEQFAYMWYLARW